MNIDKDKLLAFLKKTAVVRFEPIEEYAVVHGNALASGNDVLDKQTADELITRLNRYDLAAWFTAKVTVSYQEFDGNDYLGCCSYGSFDEFQASEDYAAMVQAAYLMLVEDVIYKANSAMDLLKNSGAI